jgi:protoporphyrinogen oxidase
MTGLAAGLASGIPVYEAEDDPGGICSSYYVAPEDNKRRASAPGDGSVYRFEKGGGHWIFGGEPAILHFLRQLCELQQFTRRSAVYLPANHLRVPYPLQNHLRYLGAEIASKALCEMIEARRTASMAPTMAEWLRTTFGETLGALFFEPFHELYTAGLWRRILPQDGYKSPVDLKLAVQGALGEVPAVGYNVTFLYPRDGLNTLAQRMAAKCGVHYGKRAVRIDADSRIVCFDDGSELRYSALLSTLPLNRMLELTGLEVAGPFDPSVSVLVINIGAKKGRLCPEDHWVYVPASQAGFHRVGFYSNVDQSFLPMRWGGGAARAALYVEKSYRYGMRPAPEEVSTLCDEVVRELQEWEWITEVEVLDPTWIDVGYTWSWPGSEWKDTALRTLGSHGINQVGRFARWKFQGIAESIRDGFIAGAAYRSEPAADYESSA